MDDILASMFGAQARGPARPQRGIDQRYTLSVSFLDAARGATQRLALPGGGDLNVQIPPGTETGQMLRLRGKGRPGTAGGPAGDALIEITVLSHPLFRRDGHRARRRMGGRAAEPGRRRHPR